MTTIKEAKRACSLKKWGHISLLIFVKSSRNARLLLYGESLGAYFYSLYIIVSDCMPKTAAVFAAAV